MLGEPAGRVRLIALAPHRPTFALFDAPVAPFFWVMRMAVLSQPSKLKLLLVGNPSVEIIKVENFGQEVEIWRRLDVSEPQQHPVLVYLASLSPGSRRTMKAALDVMAQLLTSGRCEALSLDWSQVRFQHGAALRAVLAERYAPATANKMLAAWRGTLKAAWRLGLLSSEDYGRAADLGFVRGETLPTGHALVGGELRALLMVCAGDVYSGSG